MMTPPPSTSRRTLVKGAAWAAPVVVASATIPAYAASSCPQFDTVIRKASTKKSEAWILAIYTENPREVKPQSPSVTLTDGSFYTVDELSAITARLPQGWTISSDGRTATYASDTPARNSFSFYIHNDKSPDGTRKPVTGVITVGNSGCAPFAFRVQYDDSSGSSGGGSGWNGGSWSGPRDDDPTEPQPTASFGNGENTNPGEFGGGRATDQPTDDTTEESSDASA